MIKYRVTNEQNHAVRAQAIPSYARVLAVEYFTKIECFCLTRRTLAAHEAREMPVVFYVDPKLPRDVKAITLSYTFRGYGRDGKRWSGCARWRLKRGVRRAA